MRAAAGTTDQITGNDLRHGYEETPRQVGTPTDAGDVGRDMLKPGTASGNGQVVKTLPLTEAQREIWFGAQVSDEVSCSFNQSVLVRLRGPLNREVLVETIQWLVDRHEALRVTFAPDGAEQRLRASTPVNVSFADLSALAAPAALEQVERKMREEAMTPFDLVNGPLFRAHLLRISSGEHVLLLTLHHIVCDGGSMAVLLSECAEQYSARVAGGPVPPALEQTYSAFIEEQVAAEQSAERTHSEAFWLGQFSRPAPVLALPGSRPRPGKRSYRGDSCSLRLSAAASQGLKTLSARQRCSLTTTLMAGCFLLLQKLSGQSEILLGLPIAVRSGPGGDGLVGHCVNFLPLWLRVEGDPTLAEYLGQLRAVLMQAVEHQNYTLGTLLETLNRTRPGMPLPQVSVMFNLDWVEEPIKLAGLAAEVKTNPYGYSRFDLSVGASEEGGQIELCCQYSAELFDAETIRRWLKHYETLLSAFVSVPGRRLSQYQLPRLESEMRPAEAQPTAESPQSAPPTGGSAGDSFQTPTEETLAKIWRDVIRLDEIGRNDDFFDVGGHSLLATQILARIRAAFHVELELRVIFEASTIPELAEVIDRARQEQSPAPAAIELRKANDEARQLQERLARLSESDLRQLLAKTNQKDVST